jgi:hypothetical protein
MTFTAFPGHTGRWWPLVRWRSLARNGQMCPRCGDCCLFVSNRRTIVMCTANAAISNSRSRASFRAERRGDAHMTGRH